MKRSKLKFYANFVEFLTPKQYMQPVVVVTQSENRGIQEK